MATREEAEDALYDAIKTGAKRYTDDPEALEKLSVAFANVAYGPQGGEERYRGETDYRYRSENKNVSETRSHASSDEHETKHQGERRDRPTGFAAEGDNPEAGTD